jgi:hypothetical protein
MIQFEHFMIFLLVHAQITNPAPPHMPPARCQNSDLNTSNAFGHHKAGFRMSGFRGFPDILQLAEGRIVLRTADYVIYMFFWGQVTDYSQP